MEIRDIKQQLSIKKVLNHYNLEVNKNNQTCCPFHDDKTPSLKIYQKTNTYHCFGCGATGDVIQFIQDKESCTKHEALKKATELASTNIDAPKAPLHPKINTIPFGTDLGGAFLKMQQSLHRSKKAIAYLQDRCLNDVRLDQGFNNNMFPALRQCIVYPLRNSKGTIVSFYGRSIGQQSKHYYLTDRKGLYPCYPQAATQQLILTESIIDAATIQHYTSYEVLALYGTNGLTEEHIQAISPLQELAEIILFFDGDVAGDQAHKTVTEKLHKVFPQLKITHVTTPEGEDVNSLVQNHPLINSGESEILNYLIEKRASFCLSEKQVNPPVSQGKLHTDNAEYLVYKTALLEISVLGGIAMHNMDKLKVTLRLIKTNSKSNTQPVNPLFTLRQSNIDLYNDELVTKLIRRVAERLELGTKEVQHALYSLIGALENYRLKQIESTKPDLPQKRKLNTERQQATLNFLKSPNLLQNTNALIGKTGLIGEQTNRLLMYLVFTSRLREQPLHIISLGASGTGKTYLQEKISELIPEDQKLEITALSENALYYFDRTELKNKLVLIEDLDGAQDDKILYAIRELMSKKKISKTLPVKDAKGNMKTITLKVEGPISLAGTTTKEKIYEDNANRSILIYLDNSPKQKQAIIEYQQKLSAGIINKTEEKHAIEFLKDVQSILHPIKVRNPYATQLHIPETVFKPLRTNAHYLAFIETVTFYHQYQRHRKQTNSQGESVSPYIETTIEDIEIANGLLKEVLLAKSDELTKGCREFFEGVKRYLDKQASTSFYSGDIRRSFRMSPNNVKYYLAMLSKYHFVKIIGGHPRKQGYEYEIVNQKEYEKLKSSLTILDEILKNIKSKH